MLFLGKNETNRDKNSTPTNLHFQVKFTSAVKLSEGGAAGPEYGRDEEENFFKRLGKWRSGRRNPSKLHHTEEKDGRPPPSPGGPPSSTSPHRPVSLCVPLSLRLCVAVSHSVVCPNVWALDVGSRERTSAALLKPLCAV